METHQDMSRAFRWTEPHDAQAIQEDTDFLDAMNEWEREQRWRRLGLAVRDAAILFVLVGTFLVCCALWGAS